MKKFEAVATGGTFDIIHKGHLELLSKAFSVSSHVIIGLTSDELAEKKGKQISTKYDSRKKKLISVIEQNFPNSKYTISKLDNDFGPAVIQGEVRALVVSQETSNKGPMLNSLRAQKNLPPVQVIVVPMALAQDGTPISTTRIRNSEIDTQGNLS